MGKMKQENDELNSVNSWQDINDGIKVLWILSYKSTIEAPVILPYNTKQEKHDVAKK